MTRTIAILRAGPKVANREATLEAALREIMEAWNRDDGSRMRERGDEMHDIAEAALISPAPTPEEPQVKSAPVPVIQGSRWEPTADDMELALVFRGERLGGIAVWVDNKTGDVAWWTGSVLSADRQTNVEMPGIYDTEDEARTAVIHAAIANRLHRMDSAHD